MEKVITTSKKNQITIPTWARKYLGIRAHNQVKISANQINGQKCLSITPIRRVSSLDNIWDKLDRNAKKYGSDDTPEMNAGPDMKDDE